MTKKEHVAQRKPKQGQQGVIGLFNRFKETWAGRFISTLLLALVIVIPVRTFAIQGYHIPSGSMESTLLIGDVLFADKITFGPRIPFTNGARIPGLREPVPGDIVIFKHPTEKVDLIKRCIALAGQTVEMKAKQVFVDGEPLDEPYAQHVDPGYLHRRDDFGPFVVPAEHIFVLGDNRDRSNDSRFLGPISDKAIIAKARIIYFSLNTQKWLPRINRIGRLL
ncbi:MAG: signal peptidase I [Candidatus Eisenbacteria bacterium]|uniref:Signal peptidase I n=1 Tax=Eiseniibacteriota bacterium TaxID=2212470 RepID=A0A948S0K5_UNCEI|nr:signal peptidase I [Candidatus Eisenbacteria bacterium]MBU1949448.1 signal peptidase I [Candidatus Eisenbacteria bacterium]MBU2691624.1 signal peptidase I [Candidatus Eisenbacteria bacterium]